LQKALGGLAAKAESFPDPSKLARELPHGEGPILSRSGKKFSKAKGKNNLGESILLFLAARPSRPLTCRKRLLCQGQALTGRYAPLDKAAVLPA